MNYRLTGLGLCFAVGVTGAANAQAVGIATSNPGSIFHNIGTAIANAANEAGLRATIQPATSPNQYIPLVGSGGIEFGVANLQEVVYAHDGEEWFAGQAYPDLQLVAQVMPLVEAIFVRADSNIHSLTDMVGMPMVDGYTAQQTILPQLDAIYSTEGLTRADFIPVNVPSVVAGVDAFVAGDSVGFIFAHGAGKVIEADAAVGGLRALGVDPTPENLARARAHWPVVYFTELAAGSRPGVEQDTWYPAYPQGIFTYAGASEEDVYQMTRAIYEHADTLRATFAGFNPFNPETDMVRESGSLSYHPGAIRFYREVGLWAE